MLPFKVNRRISIEMENIQQQFKSILGRLNGNGSERLNVFIDQLIALHFFQKLFFCSKDFFISITD